MAATNWDVFWYAMLTAVATGLGAVPFAFIKKITGRVMGISNSIAAGLMTGASFGLLIEAVEYSKSKMIWGLALGIVFIGLMDLLSDFFKRRITNGSEKTILKLHDTFGKDFFKSMLLIFIMTAHSAAEGIGIGTSFGGEIKFGILMSIAIAIHNIPEGLAISAVLVSQGVKWWKAALWSIFTSLPQPVLAVPAFMFVSVFKPYLPVGLGFAAGAMLWLVFSEIVPESTENINPQQAATIMMISFILILIIQFFL